MPHVSPVCARNTRLFGPQGAHRALTAIDYDHFSSAGLKTTAILYLGNEERCVANFSASYEGYARLDIEEEIMLPHPRYYKCRYGKHFLIKEVPLSCLRTPPEALEFILTATTPDEYQGLKAFVNQGIPTLFQYGYAHDNLRHTSTAWLHVGTQKPYDTTVFSIGPEGLSIYNTITPDYTTILTELDVQRLVDLTI